MEDGVIIRLVNVTSRNVSRQCYQIIKPGNGLVLLHCWLCVLCKMITQTLLQKYFDGACTPREAAIVTAWLRDDNADLSTLKAMMNEAWEEGEHVEQGGEMKGVLLQELRGQLYVKRPVRRLWGLAAAAVAAVLLLVGVLMNGSKNTHPALASGVPRWDTIANTSAYKKHVVLPDSTNIWLTPGSSIAYHERVVKLEGQAFFDVAQDAARPFVVQSGRIQTRVLGTAFNVEAYDMEAEVRVSLVQGRVAVQDSSRSLATLQAGEVLIYTRAGGAARKGELKFMDIESWKGAGAVFNQVPVKDALERLAKQYHFTIRYVGHPDLNKRFSTVFERETPEQMLQNILFITDCHFRLQGSELIIMQ